MEFRRLTPKDAESCYQNRLRALANAPTAFQTTLEEGKTRGPAFFERILSSEGENNVIFGAVYNGVVVGTTGIMCDGRPRTSHKATIWGVYVDIEHRRKGISAKLLDLSIEHARNKMGVKTIYLSVESTNTPARKLYESRGFVSWGREPKALLLDGKMYDEDHMTLVL